MNGNKNNKRDAFYKVNYEMIVTTGDYNSLIEKCNL